MRLRFLDYARKERSDGIAIVRYLRAIASMTIIIKNNNVCKAGFPPPQATICAYLRLSRVNGDDYKNEGI